MERNSCEHDARCLSCDAGEFSFKYFTMMKKAPGLKPRESQLVAFFSLKGIKAGVSMRRLRLKSNVALR